MKLIKNSIYALSLVSLMGLWSCSQDEMLQGGTDLQGHPVTLTLTVNRGDAQTRTVLSENTQTGGLYDDWVEGDVLQVYNANGENVGQLDLKEIVERNVGVFSGTVTATDGEYNLWYTNPAATGEKEADGKPIYFNSKKRLVVDLSKMPKYTSITDLSAMNVLSKKVQLKVDGNTATVTKDETMNTHLAMARFSLKGIPSDKTGTLTISDKAGTVNTDGLHQTLYKLQLDLASSGTEGTTARPQGIVVNDVKAGEDIYLAFIPGTYTLSFHMEFDGVNYDYAFTQPTKLEAGKYYNAFTKAEGAEEGVIDGVNIPLKQEVMARLHLHANFEGANPEEIIIAKPFVDGKADYDLQLDYSSYIDSYTGATLPAREGYTFKGWSQEENGTTTDAATSITSLSHPNQDYYAVWEKKEEIDHSKNPLAKWAESDLTRSGSGASAKGVLTGNYETTGSYYQFGRNYGHNSYDEINNDASKILVAKINPQWTGGSFYTKQYGTVNASALKNVYVGNGTATTGTWYTSDSSLKKKNYNAFIFAGNFTFNDTEWYLQQSWDGEVLFDTEKHRTHDWAARAEYYGYTNDLCPEGYRLPTLEDWNKIRPSTPYVYPSTDFATFSEIKTDGDVTYAIQWSHVSKNNSQYLKIQSLVVESKTKTTDGINWEDSNVVTRHFKAAGCINPKFVLARYIPAEGVQFTSYQWLARAVPDAMLLVTPVQIPETLSLINSVQITTNYNNLTGYYWIDNEEQRFFEFRFDKNNSLGLGSFIGTMPSQIPVACNIRCILK